MRSHSWLSGLVVFMSSTPVAAQSLNQVCLELARSGLIDRQNYEAVIETYEDEFDYVCDIEAERETRLSASSGSFKGSFLDVIGAEGGGGSRQEYSREEIDLFCSEKKDVFLQNISETIETSVGSNLASRIVECVEVLSKSNELAIFGLTRVDASDTFFDIALSYSQGQIPVPMRLTGITGNVECFTGSEAGQEAIGNLTLVPGSDGAMFCEKPAGAPALGSLVFTADIGEGPLFSKTVPFDVLSRNIEIETRLEIERRVAEVVDRLSEEINDLRGDLTSAPRLAIWRSGWMDVGPNQDVPVQHNLGVMPLMATLWYRNPSDGQRHLIDGIFAPGSPSVPVGTGLFNVDENGAVISTTGMPTSGYGSSRLSHWSVVDTDYGCGQGACPRQIELVLIYEAVWPQTQ